MQNRSLIPIAQSICFELKTADADAGFRIRRDEAGEVDLWMYDEQRALSLRRTLKPSSSSELDDLSDFALGVGRAIFTDQRQGGTHVNFRVRDHYVPEMGLYLGFELTNPEDNTEIEATLTFGEGEDLVSAVAVVSLLDLVAAVAPLDAEYGFGWGY